jgi:hypothetical protein
MKFLKTLILSSLLLAPAVWAASCPRSLAPGMNCNTFPEGCVYVPASVRTIPLVYFRGLIQDAPRNPPESTKALFDLNRRYRLKKAADDKGQIILATHKSTIAISTNTLRCLKSIGDTSSIDVASHSGGGVGLASSKSVLQGEVRHLYLLDNFYGRETLRAAVRKISPSSCSGFYTAHALRHISAISTPRSQGSYQLIDTSCVVKKGQAHIEDVVPALLVSPSNNRRRSGSDGAGSGH